MSLPEVSPEVSRISKVSRKGEYRVFFSDGTEIRILKDQLPGSGIEEGVSLSRHRIEELDSAYRYARCRNAALRLLKVRPRTELELRRRFKSLGAAPRIADRVMADLKTEGLVDDRVFARLWIGEKVRRGDCGRMRLINDLRAKGIERDVMMEELEAALSDGKELELAGRLAIKKMERLGRVPPGEGRRRVYAYLLRRGFTSEAAGEAVQRAVDISGRTETDEI